MKKKILSKSHKKSISNGLKIRRLNMLNKYLKNILKNKNDCYINHNLTTFSNINRLVKELWSYYNNKLWPKNMQSNHTCDNPKCINMFHIYSGTQKNNMQDMINRNRGLQGEKCVWSKLTNDNVIQIRQLWNTGEYDYHDLAKMFNIAAGTIKQIVTRRTWKHI